MLFQIFQLLSRVADGLEGHFHIQRPPNVHLLRCFGELFLCVILTFIMRMESVKLVFKWAKFIDSVFSLAGAAESVCFAGCLCWFVAYNIIMAFRNDDEKYDPFAPSEVFFIAFISIFSFILLVNLKLFGLIYYFLGTTF